MLQALKNSPEKRELIELATKYLRGVKGTLVQQKKRDREKAAGLGQNMALTNAAVAAATGRPGMLSVASGPLPAPAGGSQKSSLSNQHTGLARESFVPYVPPHLQHNGAAQRTHLQQQGARAVQTGHAAGQFDEADVENALRGFLTQG